MQYIYDVETFRETGATMLLSITYDNFKEWKGKQDIYYYYTPSIVAQSSYKYYDTVGTVYSVSMISVNISVFLFFKQIQVYIFFIIFYFLIIDSTF